MGGALFLEMRDGAMGGNMGSTSATNSDADVKLEAVYLLPNISCSSSGSPSAPL